MDHIPLSNMEITLVPNNNQISSYRMYYQGMSSFQNAIWTNEYISFKPDEIEKFF